MAVTGSRPDEVHTRLDLDRSRRTGLPEAVYAEGKSTAECVEIVGHLLDSGHGDPIIATRCTDEQLTALTELSPTGRWSRTLTWCHAPLRSVAPVALVSGGTSDAPVLEECLGTLTAVGVPTRVVRDVGVAGLHRLIGSVDELDPVSAIIAFAGMEAALPTVLAGLVAAPIIAVPTSVGYGTTFEGVTALLALLSSCAPGISVVGIDNGFGAAAAVHRIVGHGATQVVDADHAPADRPEDRSDDRPAG